MSYSVFPARHSRLLTDARQLAFSQTGDVDSPEVLVCLPGLLETRASFDPLLQAAERIGGLRVLAVDHCGRGDSDPLAGDRGYAMSVYLQDLQTFLRQEVMRSGVPLPRIHVLGTSMGGILAMYLAADAANHVHGLAFNDIGLSLYWMSIYGLYDSMKQGGHLPPPDVLARQLNVHPGVVHAVQSHTHFDLPFHKNWKGMQFAHLLKHFSGPVRLVHGGNSGVCLSDQVRELQRLLPQSQVMEVPGARHPAPFNAQVCAFLLQPWLSPKPEVVATPPTPTDATHPPGVWDWLKRRFHRHSD
jgi:pimeloyl-ACP methyl ester carboxylesterase